MGERVHLYLGVYFCWFFFATLLGKILGGGLELFPAFFLFVGYVVRSSPRRGISSFSFFFLFPPWIMKCMESSDYGIIGSWNI